MQLNYNMFVHTFTRINTTMNMNDCKMPHQSNNKGEIILYQPDNSIQMEVRIENETVWLTQAQMVMLFGRDQSVISKHIRNIFREGELDKNSVYANFAYTATDGKTYTVDFYNLDVIISVGYRIKSQRGTQFRIWATKTLKDYLLKGYAINYRLDNLENKVFSLEQNQSEINSIIQKSLPPKEGIFFDGQIFDAYIFLSDLIKFAKKTIILIDNYVEIEANVLLQNM